jgi:2,3,4,5-tetrahydropyridine-2-carboxylate N-succinyltransferase
VSADHSALASAIESAYEKRAEITPGNAPAELREAVESAVRMLDAGSARVAEKRDGLWTVNQWLKKAVLLSFRIAPNLPVEAQALKFYDKVPLKFSGWSEAQFASSGVRVVPPAS